jgi:uncharacterized membrane protein YjjP (DUF1212 family)
MLGSDDAATQARQALELALRVGDVLLAAGMSANDVVVEMLRITEAYRLSRVHVDVTFTSIAVTYYAAPTTVPMTLVRTVQPDVLDLTKVRRVQALAEASTQDCLSKMRSTTWKGFVTHLACIRDESRRQATPP